MRVVVTGGAGYIGTRLCQHLAEDASIDQIVAIDVAPPRVEVPKRKVALRDVTEPMDDLFAGADAAVHLAWVLNPIKDTARMTAVNLGGTRRFLEACARARVPRVLLASSATAYGARKENPVPLPESYPVDPAQPFQYAREKAIMEGLARGFSDTHPGVTLMVVRPCIVIGPHVHNFISRAMSRPVVALVDGLDPPVQLVHEDDVARALYALTLRGPAGTYNIGAEGLMTTREMASLLGARVLDVSRRTARLVAGVGWRLGIRSVSETPPDMIDFLRYPWVVDGAKLRGAIGFEYGWDSRAALESYRQARP
ncbi:MAG: NAD-dependent epimerase/dehydratase family protein [Myxococcota bacterium]